MHNCRDSFLLALASYGHGMSKRDLASNINFFMNVPVTPDGGLTFEDGVSGPGRYVEMRAEMDVLCSSRTVLSSTIPATPTTRRRSASWSGTGSLNRGHTMFRPGSHCQPWRDRLPHPAHAAQDGHLAGGGLLRGRSRTRRTSPWRRRSGAARAAARSRELPRRREDSRRRAANGRRGHPSGYGFLSENADFAEALRGGGHRLHRPDARRRCATSASSTWRARSPRRAICRSCQAPVFWPTSMQRSTAAERIGYPVMLKSTAGGGGIGMRRCANDGELAQAFDATDAPGARQLQASRALPRKARRRSRAIWRCRSSATAAGKVLALGERDCSVQRRQPKGSRRNPAPGLTPHRREALLASAVRLGARRAATAPRARSSSCSTTPAAMFYFLEVNTRIQVEHGVTEEVTGVDLIEWMVRLAAGELPDLDSLAVTPRGASIEARIYAEDPQRGFQPSSGRAHRRRLRRRRARRDLDRAGNRRHALLRSHDRQDHRARKRSQRSDHAPARCARCDAPFAASRPTATTCSTFSTPTHSARAGCTRACSRTWSPTSQTFEVLEPGTQTTVQDYPGRIGYWDVGIPPSGPMDALSFQLANRLLGNPVSAALLECTLVGPTLRFRPVRDGVDRRRHGGRDRRREVPRFAAIPVAAGSVLRLGAVRGPGSRAYVGVRGGSMSPSIWAVARPSPWAYLVGMVVERSSQVTCCTS